MDEKNDNDDINTKPPSFVMPIPTTATATTAVKSENYNDKTNNNNTNHTGTTKEKRKKKKKRKISPTTTAVADVTSLSSSLFSGPDRVVSSSSSPRSLLHSSNNSSSTNNNSNHDSINNTNTANTGVAILAELKKIEQRQTQRQVTMHEEMKKEFKKMQDVMTAKISSLEQTVEALRQQQPYNPQRQQPAQEQEGITGVHDNVSDNNNSKNNESEDGYDDTEKKNNGDGDGHDNDNDDAVYADEEDENEIQEKDEIIDKSGDDDDGDDWIENNGDEYNNIDDESETTAAAATLLVTVTFDDEDTNNKRFKDWKRKYDILQKYVTSNSGSFPVQKYNNKQDGFSLGSWMSNQKIAYRNSRNIISGRPSDRWMTKPRVAYLEQLTNWTWGKQVSFLAEKEFADDENTRNNNRALLKEEDTNRQHFKTWNHRYESFKEYVKSNNGQLPVLTYKIEKDGFALGKWVTDQKSRYWNTIKGRVRGSTHIMTKPRAQKLESILNWTWGACYVDGTNKEQRDVLYNYR